MSAFVLSLWKGQIPRRERMADILGEIAGAYGLTVAELLGPSRKARVAQPRHHAMFEVRRRTNLSLPDIGRRMGGRDHTTVLHGVRQHEKRMAEVVA